MGALCGRIGVLALVVLRHWGMLTAFCAIAIAADIPVVAASGSMVVTGAAAADGPRPLNHDDAEAWLDNFMRGALIRYRIAGAVVAIVKDGKPLLVKGYGYADSARRVPVDPNRHLFRVASISKLFTWTAVMQQVEIGRLDLDVDVNRYLDFTIPPYHGRPVTLRHLLTQSAGFELVMRDLFSARPVGTDLGATVKHWTPHRIYAPGSTPTYSNYGAALAGYIVERVAGEPYDAYIDRHILQPLGMAKSSMRQPLPPTLAGDLSKAYLDSAGLSQPFEYTLYRPAGALAATAPDIARFMIAHLDDGAFGTGRILRPDTMREMHATAFRALPPLNGMTLGFAEHGINGHRVIAHDGDTRFFHSQLNLFVDDRVGIFVSLNSSGRDDGADVVRTALFRQFADRYFPAAQKDGTVAPVIAAEHARAMTGWYEASTRSASNFLAINDFEEATRVTVDHAGHLHVPALTGEDGAPMKWHEIAPFIWREVGGKERLAAHFVDGRPVRFSIDDYSPLAVWDRMPWWRSAGWLWPLSRIAYAVLLLEALGWLAMPLARRLLGSAVAAPLPHGLTYLGLHLAALVAVSVPLVWSRLIPPIMTFTANPDTIAIQIIAASLLTFVGFCGGLVMAALDSGRHWSRRRLPRRLWSLVLVIAFAALSWVAAVYQLFSFSTDF